MLQELTRSCSGTFKAKKAQQTAGGGWTHQARFEQQPRWEKRVEQSYNYRLAVPVSSNVAKECNCSHVNAHVLCDFYNWWFRQ